MQSSRNPEKQRSHITLATRATSGAVAYIPDEIKEQDESGERTRVREEQVIRKKACTRERTLLGVQPRHTTRSATQKRYQVSTQPAGDPEDQTTGICYSYQQGTQNDPCTEQKN